MVRRALESNIQCNLQSKFLRACYQSAEIFESPQLWVNRFMPAFLRTDGPRASDVLGSRLFGIVLTLSVSTTYRMNRGKIENIKSHARDVLQPFLTIPEGPVLKGHCSARSRKHLVPRAKPGSFTIDNHPLFLAIDRGLAAICVQHHQSRQLDI